LSKSSHRYIAGGWSTRRGEEEGILVHIKGIDGETASVWFDKQAATRFAHTVLEAQIRFWDILWHPDEIRGKVKGLADRVGMEVTEPYREGCPFCQHVSNSEADMMQHLKDEHTITLILTKEEE
jgi:hypothetical protein